MDVSKGNFSGVTDEIGFTHSCRRGSFRAASYFRTLEAQIVRQETELTNALAARGTQDLKLSPSLAPAWRDDTAR